MHQKYLNNSEPSRIFSILDPLKGSIFLDFMVSSRDIVLKYVTWEINIVDNISFWRDSWNGQPLLTILPDVHNIIQLQRPCGETNPFITY